MRVCKSTYYVVCSTECDGALCEKIASYCSYVVVARIT